MAAKSMGVVGFVPNPETAAMVVAWVQALAREEESTSFLCLETEFDGRTTQQFARHWAKRAMTFRH